MTGTPTTTADRKRSPAVHENIAQLIERVEAAIPGVLPHHTLASGLNQRQLAVARFLSQLCDEDPRWRAAHEAFDELMEALEERLGSDGRDLRDMVSRYHSDSLRAAGALAPELDRWVGEMLRLPGGEEMLDAIWNRDGLPDSVVKAIIERARTEDLARVTAEKE